ncbi:MAG: 50S ribosomal protein L23 [Alphaproteobacteria bacterium]|nr:MAG: 50S ribosomal protein L23 [Alphaproteobacteria bacterium]
MRKKNSVRVADARCYDVIRAPLITEKSTIALEQGKVTFAVPLEVSKYEIKFAVEKIFNVHVVSVNTLVRKGKTRRFRGREGKLSDTKKAIVTLKAGETIDFGIKV